MFGLLGSIVGTSNDEWHRKPQSFSGQIIIDIPDDASIEQKIRMQQYAQEKLLFESMSKSEQLDYLRAKNGL